MSEYKRLTERYIDEQGSKCVRKLAWDGEILHRLAELEDRIENGTLVELPCKVGATIYSVEYFCYYRHCSADDQIYCCGCKEMKERERNHEKYVIAEKKFALSDLPLIGKKYFTDKSQAEARLKELQAKEE